MLHKLTPQQHKSQCAQEKEKPQYHRRLDPPFLFLSNLSIKEKEKICKNKLFLSINKYPFKNLFKIIPLYIFLL